MPLRLPVLDDRNFEQLLDEAKRRIPSYTPEWTNYGVESDPGITVVQLFAFLVDSLLYRANRIPDRNRLKFLQLLGVPMQPAAPADGIIAIHSERAPLLALPLNAGVVVSAGTVDFLTRDPVNVLPVETQVYFKRRIAEDDPRYAQYQARYEAVQIALAATQSDEGEAPGGAAASESTSSEGGSDLASIKLDFYETVPMALPTPANPSPVLDLGVDALDQAIYLALLAPPNVAPDDVRPIIANQTLSIGVVPALSGEVQPLRPLSQTPSSSTLIFEIASPQSENDTVARYLRLNPQTTGDVLNATGIAMVRLPGADALHTWTFTDPLQEGTGDFPPKLEDEQLLPRLITWLRIRLPKTSAASASGPTSGSASGGAASGGTGAVTATPAPVSQPSARLTWVGINAARVQQAVAVTNELVGLGTGEPDQVFTLANAPVLPTSIRVVVQDVSTGTGGPWRLIDDLLAAGVEDPVFTLDPESGEIRFGDGLHGARPQAGWRVLASYEYGGGPSGNVGVGAIKASRDPRLQGGYRIENPVPTSGGDRGETIDQATQRIPEYLRHRERLVTQDDFRDIAQSTPGVDVGRVEVLPLFLPSDPPQENAPGVVTLLAIPLSDPVRPLWPTPDRLFLQRICDYLDSRRLVTTEIYVRGPQYLPVYLSVGVSVRAGYFADAVRQDVRDTLNLYLSALFGGPDGTGWPLGHRLMKKELEAVATRVAGVDYVDSLELGVNNPSDIGDAEFPLSGLQLPYVAGIAVVEGSAEPLDSAFGPPTPPSGPKVVPVPVSRTKC